MYIFVVLFLINLEAILAQLRKYTLRDCLPNSGNLHYSRNNKDSRSLVGSCRGYICEAAPISFRDLSKSTTNICIIKKQDYIVSFFFHGSFHTVFLCIFLHTTKNFKMIYLCEYLESWGLPHHSFNVFLPKDSIFECFRTICELLGPPRIHVAQCH